MTLIITSALSILLITFAVWLADKFSPVYVCPICAGISVTWLWLLGANFFSYAVNLTIPAMLMGGSVVGIAYQLDKKMPSGRSSLLWKSLFIPTGFLAAYSLLTLRAPLFGVLAMTLILLWAVFFKMPLHAKAESTHSTRSGLMVRGAEPSKKVDELEKKMEECC